MGSNRDDAWASVPPRRASGRYTSEEDTHLVLEVGLGSKRWVQAIIITLLFFRARLRAQHSAENRESRQEVGRKEKGSKFY